MKQPAGDPKRMISDSPCKASHTSGNLKPGIWNFPRALSVLWGTFLGFILLWGAASAQKPDSLYVGVNTSIRALQVVNDSVLWFGGSKGWIGRSTNAGRSWQRWQPGGDKLDFRTLYAHSDEVAIAANAGSPANILYTHDGGKTWARIYHNADSNIFLDGVDFWDKQHGILFGDPMDGKLFLLRTSDGGKSWTALPPESRPLFAPGEAAFAASGTSIRCVGDSTVVVVSGGSTARLWYSHNRGNSWQFIPTNKHNRAIAGQHLLYPENVRLKADYILQGEPSQGAFSVALTPDSQYVVVGGDYRRESATVSHIATLTYNMWWKPRTPTRGYRECVQALSSMLLVATGPTGSDISHNGGLDWLPLHNLTGMHVVRQSPHSNRLFMAGAGGVMYRYDSLPVQAVKGWSPATALGKSIHAGKTDRLERKLKRLVRQYGKGQKSEGGYYVYHQSLARLAAEIQQIEGLEGLTLDSCGIRLAIYPAHGKMMFLLSNKQGLREYCLLFREGGIRRGGFIRHKLGLSMQKNRLTNPKLTACPDAIRRQHISCEFERP